MHTNRKIINSFSKTSPGISLENRGQAPRLRKMSTISIFTITEAEMLAVVGNSTRMVTTTIYRSSTFPTKILIPIPISGKSIIKQQINSPIKIPWPVIQIMVIGIDQASPILTILMDMEAKYHRNSHHPTLLALRKTNPSSSLA